MAGEIIIKYKEKGFWIHDIFVEVLSQFLCEAFEGIGLNNFSENLLNIYSDCDANRKGYNTGSVDILFTYFILSVEDKGAMISVIDKAAEIIKNLGNELSISYLNNIENAKPDLVFRKSWRIPIKTQSLIATLNMIKQLINGTYEPTLGSVYYVGYNNPDGVKEV